MPDRLQKLLSRRNARPRGQSFVEMALVVPILLLMLLGLVEVAFFMSKYLDGLDLTREAARFASIRDPFSTTSHDSNCNDPNGFDFFWDTSCIFSPPTIDLCAKIDPAVIDIDLGASRGFLNWCNGLNKYLAFDPTRDDIVISAFSIGANNEILQNYPIGNEYVTDEDGNRSYYWALSNHIYVGADANASPLNDNWRKSCTDTPDTARLPYYTKARVHDTGASSLTASDFPDGSYATPPDNRGFISVELYYCHDQVLGLPLFTIFVPNPIMIHVYTLMPLPAAAPTPTPATIP